MINESNKFEGGTPSSKSQGKSMKKEISITRIYSLNYKLGQAFLIIVEALVNNKLGRRCYKLGKFSYY